MILWPTVRSRLMPCAQSSPRNRGKASGAECASEAAAPRLDPREGARRGDPSKTGLGRGRRRRSRPSEPERALLVAICMLCRRLSRETAHQLVAQLPSRLQPGLRTMPRRAGSERHRRRHREGARLGCSASMAKEHVLPCKRCQGSRGKRHRGEIAEMCGQLPEEMRSSSPSSRDRLGIEGYCGA